MKNIKIEPEMVPIFIPIPKINANPIRSRASINNQSVKPLPPIALKIFVNGPLAPLARNPNVGEPPLIHALSGAVAKPHPNSLSKKAHKN